MCEEGCGHPNLKGEQKGHIFSSSASSVIQSLGPEEAPGGQCLHHLQRQTPRLSQVPGTTIGLVFLQRLPGLLAGWQAGHLTYLDEPIQKIGKEREGMRRKKLNLL